MFDISHTYIPKNKILAQKTVTHQFSDRTTLCLFILIFLFLLYFAITATET